MTISGYIVFGLFWALFALKVQTMRTPEAPFKQLLAFLLNLVAWPICIIIAIINFEDHFQLKDDDNKLDLGDGSMLEL